MQVITFNLSLMIFGNSLKHGHLFAIKLLPTNPSRHSINKALNNVKLFL